MVAKEAMVTCPYKDNYGYCCHRKMVPLSTSPKVKCPFKNVKKCRLFKQSIANMDLEALGDGPLVLNREITTKLKKSSHNRNGAFLGEYLWRSRK